MDLTAIPDDFKGLIARAQAVTVPRRLSETATCGTVGAALETAAGEVFVGICVDTSSSVGFCAEHAAAASMLTAGQSQVVRMVAVNSHGQVLAPCGRCREFISQLAEANLDTEVLVGNQRVMSLHDLLPYRWPKD